MSRFAMTATLSPGRVTKELPTFTLAHATDPGTAGNVFISFDNTVIKTASDLSAAFDLIALRAIGYGGLTP